MTDKNLDKDVSGNPAYSIGEIMALLGYDEQKVRKLIKKAGIKIDELKQDPGERIRYEDFRYLWISLANRREGRLLETLLIEESSSWFGDMFRKRR